MYSASNCSHVPCWCCCALTATGQQPETMNQQGINHHPAGAAAGGDGDGVDGGYYDPSQSGNSSGNSGFVGEGTGSIPSDDDDGDDDGGGDDDELSVKEDLKLTEAKKQTRHVRRTRLLVLLILVSAAAAVSAVVYLYTRNQQVQAFETTFDGYAQRIVDTVQRNARYKLEAVSSLALQIQSYAINSNRQNNNDSMSMFWPFVTVPHFEEMVLATKSLTDAYGVLLFPVVDRPDRQLWERYSLANRGWLNESYRTQRYYFDGQDGLELDAGEPGSTSSFATHDEWFDKLWGPDFVHPDNPDYSQGIASQIFKTQHDADEDPEMARQPWIIPYGDDSAHYFPQWQASPANWYYQSSVNLDYGSYPDFFSQTQIVNETHTAVYGMAWTDAETGFLSTMLYPIFDQFASETGGARRPNVVAFLSIDIYWQAFLKDMLPPTTTDAVRVVISNTCNQNFTYEVLGDRVEFVSDGDEHDPRERYEALSQSTLFGEDLMQLNNSSSSNGTATMRNNNDPDDTYTGVPLYGDFCPYNFTVYPSAEMESAYVNNIPIIYTVIACLIFLFTSLVFILYDYLVERRQQMTMESAARSDAIVASLFPSEVKQKMYDEHQEKISKEERDKKEKKRQQQQSMAGNRRQNLLLQCGVSSRDLAGATPIASLYPETSILFADLAGFTSWSSNRQPSDVFLLLESIYGAFDKIARKRGVFKVETIGDCYVAVTGIPRPQAKHFIIMVRFAHECAFAMKDVAERLAPRLGKQTLELAMRVGIHSGPVTGGVLRGEKARFQLFGDTMNTASRMESNGVKGRIHVSEDTASLLIQAGKSHWVQPREEKITAKGKGEMQTYWVAVPTHTASMTSRSCNDDTTRQLDEDDPGIDAIAENGPDDGDMRELDFDHERPSGSANDSNDIKQAMPEQQPPQPGKQSIPQQQREEEGRGIATKEDEDEELFFL